MILFVVFILLFVLFVFVYLRIPLSFFAFDLFLYQFVFIFILILFYFLDIKIFSHVQFPRIRKYAAEALYMQMLSDRHGVGMKENEIKDLIIIRNNANIELDNNVDIDDKNNKNEIEIEIENSNDNIQNTVNNSTQKIKYTLEKNTIITPYFCGFARTYEQLEIISDFLASTTWDGELGGARGKRLELCVLMELNMETKARTVGKYDFIFFIFFYFLIF